MSQTAAAAGRILLCLLALVASVSLAGAAEQKRIVFEYARLDDSKRIEKPLSGLGDVSRATAARRLNALLTIFDFVGKKGVPLENFVDHAITDPLVREGFIEKPYKK